jgi:hypothetical protein
MCMMLPTLCLSWLIMRFKTPPLQHDKLSSSPRKMRPACLRASYQNVIDWYVDELHDVLLDISGINVSFEGWTYADDSHDEEAGRNSLADLDELSLVGLLASVD